MRYALKFNTFKVTTLFTNTQSKHRFYYSNGTKKVMPHNFTNLPNPRLTNVFFDVGDIILVQLYCILQSYDVK